MGKSIQITSEKEAWLHKNHRTHTIRQISAHLECCPDTTKRILVRLGLRDYTSERYQVARPTYPTWTRPCMRCGSRAPRPKNQYICDPCTEKNLQYTDAHA